MCVSLVLRLYVLGGMILSLEVMFRVPVSNRSALPTKRNVGFHMTSSKIFDHANYDQFSPNFSVSYKTIYVSVTNLKSIRPLKAQLWAQIVEEFYIML